MESHSGPISGKRAIGTFIHPMVDRGGPAPEPSKRGEEMIEVIREEAARLVSDLGWHDDSDGVNVTFSVNVRGPRGLPSPLANDAIANEIENEQRTRSVVADLEFVVDGLVRSEWWITSDMTREVRIASMADWLVDLLSEETHVVRPRCPRHPHALLFDTEAMRWTCPSSPEWSWSLGELPRRADGEHSDE
jgi:hypothetical protein